MLDPLIRPNILSAAAFGWKGDGLTDNTAAAILMRSYLRTVDGCTVHFEPGVYRHANPLWLKGVKNVRVIGYGAKFQNTFEWIYDSDASALVLNPDYFTDGGDNPIRPGDSTTPAPTYLIESAPPYSTLVRLVNPIDLANFNVGEYVLIHGFEQQTGGYPPNVRYHEIRRIRGIDQGTGIELDSPILNSYDSRWYGIPASVVPLSRGSFQLAHHIELEGIEFMDHATREPSPSQSEGRGQIYLSGARSVTLIGVKGGIVTPTMVERFEAVRCELGYVEMDKVISACVFDKCTISSLTGGTGVDDVVVKDCTIVKQLSAGARHVRFDNCRIHTYDHSGGSYAKAGVGGETVVLNGCRFFRRPGETSKLVQPGDVLRSITALGTGAGYIDVDPTANIGWLQFLSIGTLIYTGELNGSLAGGNGKRGVVSAIYQSGTNLRIEADFNEAPAIGDNFFYSPIQHFTVQDCFDVRTNGVTQPIQAPFAFRPQFYRNTVENGRVRQLVVPLPADTGNHVAEVNGYLLGVTVIVARIATAAAVCDLLLYPSGPYSEIVVDMTVQGISLHTPWEERAADGSVAAGFGLKYVKSMNYVLRGSPTSFPIGSIGLEVVEHM